MFLFTAFFEKDSGNATKDEPRQTMFQPEGLVAKFVKS